MFNADFSVIIPSISIQACAYATYKLDGSLYILKVFHDFVEGISQTQRTQTEMKGWKNWLRWRLLLVNTPHQEAIGWQTRSRVERNSSAVVSESWPYTVISTWKLLTLQADQIGVSLVKLYCTLKENSSAARWSCARICNHKKNWELQCTCRRARLPRMSCVSCTQLVS